MKDQGGDSVWYDADGDDLEFTRTDASIHFVDLGGGVSTRVTEEGETIGLAVLNVRSRKPRDLPFDVTFAADPSQT